MPRQIDAEIERRAAPRYVLQLPTILEWRDEQGAHVRGAFTRDVSAKGLRVMCADAPPIATSVSVRALLPVFKNSNAQVQVKGEGEVARILGEDEGLGIAIAAVLELPDIDDNEEDLAALLSH